MFKFLKNKLKDVKEKFSKKIENEGKEEIVDKIIEETEKKEIIDIAEPDIYDEKDVKKLEEEDEITPKEEGFMDGYDKSIGEKFEKKENIFKKITRKVTSKKINDKQFEELFWDLEVGLLESNVAIEVIEKLKESLRMDLVNVDLEKGKIEDIVEKSLKESIKELFNFDEFDLIDEIKKSEKPYVILFMGVNGVGKTLSVTKVAKYLKNNGLKVIMAAGDLFRAAGAEQLEELGKKIDVPVMSYPRGGDSCALIFDTIKRAKAKNFDVVLADTAGRMHSNENLIRELEKINRVNNPNLKLFVIESIVGNDAIIQAKTFDKEIGIDGFMLTKLDIDEKGGAALSISYVTGKPIFLCGTGQNIGDIEKFNLEKFMGSLGFT